MFVFDGGTLDERTIASLRIRDDELRAFDFVPLEDARTLLRPYVWKRLERASRANVEKSAAYLEGA